MIERYLGPIQVKASYLIGIIRNL